ncbi:MAG TPA: type II toxin-antitoxin system RelE/ParE family toxin [Ignavibacteria bacterium]|nr:type II toxin-antitoxin system RelE/ParE family toxin [Ignavibacteria bacterium]HRF65620.1 type II toxin-antitoxin system RelE/ParE family toxin [Ignavibacteria bacterium]HRJ03348.1 type II toxin-antitoxin system RelE/ParE family toxin [Ignavibacteria bacterium]
MVRKVVFSSKAENDLALIIEYLKNEWSDKQIRDFNSILNEKLEVIVNYPKSYPSVINNNNIRKCVLIKQISLFYLIKKESISVLRLFDTRSNPSKLKL